jgi:hypothetical protein
MKEEMEEKKDIHSSQFPHIDASQLHTSRSLEQTSRKTMNISLNVVQQTTKVTWTTTVTNATKQCHSNQLQLSTMM